MSNQLRTIVFVMGFMQMSVLVASALVPIRLHSRHRISCTSSLAPTTILGLRRLHCAGDRRPGATLHHAIARVGQRSGIGPRGICAFGSLFWGLRLSLQPVLDVKPYLTTLWLRIGYHTLTGLFTYFTIVYSIAALFKHR